MSNPTLYSAFLHMRIDVTDGPVLVSAADDTRNVKVTHFFYEQDLVSGVETVDAHGRPTTGRRGMARSGGLIRDETLAVVPDDQAAEWTTVARQIAAGLPALRDNNQGGTTP